jgi:gas vesicle protein
MSGGNIMRSRFASGMVLGGIVGATMSMIINKDIDMDRARKRMMRIGRNMYKRTRRMISDIANIF